jgi:ferritin-like metal-binding protein YciE
MQSIQELLVEEMRDLYDAEKQLVKALPKMVKAATNESLKEAFQSHFEQTQGHVERLERAFDLLEEKPKGKPCLAMKGLVAEAQQALEEEMPDSLMDSAIICAAQKVEHYEIAGYGTVAAWANTLGLDEVAAVLEETLREEKEADEKLTQLSEEDILPHAVEAASFDEAEGELVEDETVENELVETSESAKGSKSTSRGRRNTQ